MNLEQDIDEILAEALADDEYYAKLFYPEIFTRQFGYLLRQIKDFCNKASQKRVIAAPRGTGKTTYLTMCRLSKVINFRLRRVILFVTATADNAILHTEDLKSNMMASTIAQEIFGPLSTEDVDIAGAEINAVLRKMFSKKTWVANGHTIVIPKGRGQYVRGIKWRGGRPDEIVIDDLEDADEITSENYRAKTKRWLYADLLKTVDPYSNDWTITYIDTLKHEDSCLAALLASPEWDSLRLEACDEDLNPTDPSYATKERLQALQQEHEQLGLGDVFQREYRNVCTDAKSRTFKEADRRYFWEDDKVIHIPGAGATDATLTMPKNQLTYIVVGDPAKTVKLKSDESAIVVAGFLPGKQWIFIFKIIAGHFEPDQFVDHLLSMVVAYKASYYGYEVTSLNRFISKPVETAAAYMGVRAKGFPITSNVDKESRIKWLQPYYSRHLIHHKFGECVELESQLRDFPASKRWDVMDATAYIPWILAETGLSFIRVAPKQSEMEKLMRELQAPVSDMPAWRAPLTLDMPPSYLI